MKRPGRRIRLIAATGLVLAAYPAFVLGTVYAHWFRMDFPGGRNGPSDAYRHSLASATVAYTTSPRLVALVTSVMEDDGLGNPMRAMDAHNNRIGARIGATATSWNDMQAKVLHAVQSGAVDAANADQITWLPQTWWRDRMY